MLCYDSGHKLESRKDYKNRVFKKHTDKIQDSLRQIKDCSLHDHEKKQLKQQIINLITETL